MNDITIRGMVFSSELDRDDEMEVECGDYPDVQINWINRDEAKTIVDHLTKTFSL